jgi:succinate-semialdehyde dehydrogenase / glutarate-semialdehyde dehydrogenase
MATAEDTGHAAGLYVDGQWLDPSRRAGEPVHDPATGKTIGRVPHADADDLARALAAAEAAWPRWRATAPTERAAILRRTAGLMRERQAMIARTLTREQGKPLAEAMQEVAGAAAHFDWMAEEGRRAYGRIVPGPAGVRQTVLRQPIGVVAAFAPWNFPATTPAKKWSAALAAGCCCILKGAEETPGTATAIMQALHDAGLPRGVAQLVFGDPAAISATLIASPVVRKVSFTGSTAVGRLLARQAGEALKPITMELGGHAPVLVFADVDVERVASKCVTAKFRNAGQVCVSPTRFLVAEPVYAAFVEAFAASASRIRVGHGLAADTTMGPLANARRHAAIDASVQQLRDEGARLVLGGLPIARTHGEGGHFFEPTVFADVPSGAQAMREEPFGPLALIAPFRDEADALARANALPYGLAAYAFTRDGARQLRLSEGLDAGLVGLNAFSVNGPETPWGGVKDSGYGSEGGSEGLAGYQVSKLAVQGLVD